MTNTKRNAVIIAVVLIIAGLFTCAWVFHRIGGDFSKLDTVHFEPTAYEVTESFRSVDIYDAEYDVNIVVLKDGDMTCRVETAEADKDSFSVRVENGVLKINRKENRRWYDYLGFFLGGDPHVTTVYLPLTWFERTDDSYDDLNIRTVSGDVSVQRDLEFRNVNISTTSGDVDLAAGVSQDWSVKTTSGDVSVVKTGGWHGSVMTVSGEVKAYEVSVDKLEISATSGDVRLNGTATEGSTVISTTSGDVELLNSNAGEFDIKTVSGEVRGNTGIRNYEISTVSGDVSTPQSDADADPCRIKTTSGDIELN